MFALFGSLSLAARAAFVGGVLLVAGGAFAWWSVHQYNKGWHAAINSVAARDQEAVNAANEAGDRFRDCVDGGRVWRPSTGECE